MIATMATKDNTPGLFSRVANFVRSPSATTAAADKLASSQSAENSTQAIKRVLARKAHNDAVRKREFAQLRKLRQASSEEAVKMVGRDSFFLESSGFSVLEERASTLKKIDEIEAQMSKQWWKNRQDNVAPTEPQPAPAVTSLMPDHDNLSEVETRNSFAATLPTDLGMAGSGASTNFGSGESRFTGRPGPVTDLMNDRAQARQFELTGNSAFSISKMVSIEMGQAVSDPVLEDAAIRFANGDDAGAETVLLDAMRAKDAEPEARDTWAAALFDLYRGTGQQQSFDRFALEYAQRFDRTAPVWFSTPEQLGAGQDAGSGAGVGPGPRGPWICPPQLDLAAAGQLRAVLRLGREAAELDFRAIESIAPDALVPLAAVLALCCEQPLQLRLQGEAVLGELLRVQTPAGNSRVEPVWWRLRLDLLRILGQQADFELVAMDYCITYEVSPPSWMPAKCERHAAHRHGGHAQPHDAEPVTQRHAPEATVALSGELIGDASALLQGLGSSSGADLLVSCEHLIRVDFAAAGSILNWVTNCHSQGQQIEFFQAPRLVGAFFSLVGINEHAKIMVRAN